MLIHWVSEKLKINLESEDYLTRSYDTRVARKVAQRLRELGDAPTYAQLPPATGKHANKQGKRLLYYAVDIPGLGEKRGKLRLLFLPFGQYDTETKLPSLRFWLLN